MEKTIKNLDIYVSDGNYSSKYPRSDEFVEKGVPFIRGNNMVDGDIIDDDMYYISSDKHSVLLKGHVKSGDVLITTRGNIGQVAIVPERHEDSNINAQIVLLRPNQETLYNRYLLWALQSRSARDQYLSLQTGTALKQLPVGKLEQVRIKLKDIVEQQRIAKILDKLYEIIKIRKKEIEFLDNLIKARFVEMFGDSITNPRNLEIESLGELSCLITKGASPSWQGFSYTEDTSQTLFVTSENIREGYIDLSSPKYIEDGFNEKQKRSVLHYGDFLINIVGASIGRAAQFLFDYKANINQAAALVRLNDKRIIDKYLLIYLNSEKAQQMYNSMKSDTGRANLSLQDISNLSILIPPISEQIEFERFVEQVDKSKVAIQKSLDETQLLFDSLMQAYFG